MTLLWWHQTYDAWARRATATTPELTIVLSEVEMELSEIQREFRTGVGKIAIRAAAAQHGEAIYVESNVLNVVYAILVQKRASSQALELQYILPWNPDHAEYVSPSG